MTGFEPFGGSRVNPSREVLPLLVARAPRGVDLAVELLPVVGGSSRDAAPARLAAAVRRHDPAVLLCLGETGSRGSICVERVAINLRDYRIPDNAGSLVRDEPIVRSGAAAMMSTLPVHDLVDAMRSAGAPCELSLSAGAFLCNEIMYHALRIARRRGLRAAGFIHLPRLPEQVDAGDPTRLSLPLERTGAALRAAIAVLARPRAPRRSRRRPRPSR